jgi:hypothetical protein
MTSYWFSDFCALFNSFSINPLAGTDKNFQYNSLTRLIIVLSIVGALIYQDDSIGILLTGGFSVILSIAIYFLTLNSPGGVENRLISSSNTEYSKGEYAGGLTDHGRNILEDYETNTKNSFLINQPIVDTEASKHKFFLDGNKTPKDVTEEIIPPPINNLFAQQVMTGTVKQLNSMQNKNISPV